MFYNSTDPAFRFVPVSKNPASSEDRLLVQRTFRNSRLFKDWPDEQVQELCAGARVIRAAGGENIVRQGEVLNGLYVIATGCVEIGLARADGRHFIRRFAEPGYVFGFPSVFDGKGTSFSYKAHELAQLVFVRKPDFLSILERHPELWLSVVREVVGYQRLTLDAIEESMFERFEVRLARLLVSLAEAFGVREGRGTAIHIKLTQDSLGHLLGATRQSVSRELKRFEKDGLIIINYGRITLANPPALERIAQAPTSIPLTTRADLSELTREHRRR